MIALLRGVGMAMLPALVAGSVTIEARAVTSVSVDAPIFDERSTAPYGCPPAGCVGENTRDDNAESRWSCKASLNPAGSGCSITYTFGQAQDLSSLEIDLYKGQIRTRTIDILLDGEYATSWTSSGSSLGFETIPLPSSVAGQPTSSIELIGAGSDSQWFSVEEVRIMVTVDELPPPTPAPTVASPPPAVPTTAPTFLNEAPVFGTTIVVTGDLYDTRTAAENGCDPAGCVPTNIRTGINPINFVDDDDFNSRWSCKPELGGPGAKCSVTLDVGAVYQLAELRLAFYKGDERTRTMEVDVDGTLVTTYTSSGESSLFEIIDITGPGRVITVTGVLEPDEWFSILESEVWVTGTGMPFRRL